jgi:hypothetical protein
MTSDLVLAPVIERLPALPCQGGQIEPSRRRVAAANHALDLWNRHEEDVL